MTHTCELTRGRDAELPQHVEKLNRKPIKICFLLRSLTYGGAERQLVLLAKGLHERGHHVAVITFYSGGPLEKELREAGVRIRPLYKRGRWDVLVFLIRLTRIMWEERPDILHGYLTGQNLIAVLIKPLFPSIKIVWGVRSAIRDLGRREWLDSVSFKLTCWLSRFADAIIANSHAGREYHVAMGYPAKKTVVIRNGIDTERYHCDPKARERIRREWGVTEHEELIGVVGRLNPVKDHPTFLNAAALLACKRRTSRFVCIGDGPAEYREELYALAENLGLGERLLWVGNYEDMPAAYNALDITVSSSLSEGMPNVISEAMACGVPCVVTNVGDSAWVVGDQGEVVPPKNSVAIVDAIERLLNRRTYDPTQIRQRIVNQVSLSSLIDNMEQMVFLLLDGSVSKECLEPRGMKVL